MPRRRKHPTNLPPRTYPHGNKFRMRVVVSGKPSWHTYKARTPEGCWEEYFTLLKPKTGTVALGVKRYMEKTVPDRLRTGKMAQATWRTEKRRCEAVMQVFGHMRPDDITAVHLYEYADEVSDGWRHLKRLSAMWRWFIRWGMATHDPFIKFDWPTQNARTRYVTDPELELAITAAYADGQTRKASLRVWATLMMTYLTGRRITDVRKIKLSQIEKGVGIHFAESKTSKLALPGWSDAMDEAIEDIKAALHSGTKIASFYLICNTKGQLCSEGSLNQAMQRLRPKFTAAGLEPFQLRDIRAKYGTDHPDGAHALNHSNLATFLKHYKRKASVIAPLK